MEIEDELKEKLKKQRLNQYKMQIFTLEMDIAALDAVGDIAAVASRKKNIADLKAAFAAIEAM